MASPKFAPIEKRAVKRKGGAEALAAILPTPASSQKLRRRKDDRYLSAMARCIFQSGFSWKVVDAKWDDIEAAMRKFAIMPVATLDEGDIAELVADARMIRHRGKIESIRENARFVREVQEESGSFGKYLAAWPADDTVGLWADLKKRGHRLGGNTGTYFLRSMGVDTFMLTPDVVKCLVAANVIDKKPTSKKDLAAAQEAFNRWRDETGYSLSALSRIAACSVD